MFLQHTSLWYSIRYTSEQVREIALGAAKASGDTHQLPTPGCILIVRSKRLSLVPQRLFSGGKSSYTHRATRSMSDFEALKSPTRAFYKVPYLTRSRRNVSVCGACLIHTDIKRTSTDGPTHVAIQIALSSAVLAARAAHFFRRRSISLPLVVGSRAVSSYRLPYEEYCKMQE